MKGKENITKSLIELCKGKDVLFIENDFGLYNSVGNFEEFCIEHKIKYHTVLDAERINIESLIEQIQMHDIIVWESQYVSDVSHNLKSLIYTDKIHPKKLIECYINEPFLYYLPEETKHSIFLLNSFGWEKGLEGVDDWAFYQLKEDRKAIWDKKEDEL
jgi:hypothetical protein